MIRQILAGNKTQTRRVVKPQPEYTPDDCWAFRFPDRKEFYTPTVSEYAYWQMGEIVKRCPYGTIGDRLWVRESFYIDHIDYAEGGRLGGERPNGVTDDQIYYPTDGRNDRPHWCCQLIPECACHEVGKAKARSGRFMPRWASRITLEITNVRVERLRNISNPDIRAEGVGAVVGRVELLADVSTDPSYHFAAKARFERLWDKINGKTHSWSSNPWVWVIDFKVIKRPDNN